MAPEVLRLLKFIHRQFGEFWAVWVLVSVSITMVAAWVMGRTPVGMNMCVEEKQESPGKVRGWSWGAVIALFVLLGWVVCYAVIAIKGEDFAYYDNSFFTLFTLRGKDLPLGMWIDMGRFWPLGHQEFNVIRHFTTTAAGYHVFPIIQLVFFLAVLLLVDDELKIGVRAALAALLLVLPSFENSFNVLVVPERNVLLWLACLVLFLKRFDRTRASVWAVAAVVSAQIMAYYKETAFLLILTIALVRLILRCRGENRSQWDFSQLWRRESRLDLCLLAVAVVFLGFYLVVMFHHFNMGYRDRVRIPWVQVLAFYAKMDLLPWLLLVFACRRLYLLLFRSSVPSPLWDSLACAGVVYFGAFLYLGLPESYYLAPVDMIAALCIGRSVVMEWKSIGHWRKAAVWGAVCAILVQGVTLSLFGIYERKNIVQGQVQIANAILARYEAEPGSRKRLFFPYAEPYMLTEFAAYLTYRGIAVDGMDGQPTSIGRATLVSKTFSPTGPCRDFICIHADEPEPADLVIIFPEDYAPLTERNRFRSGGELLLSYSPNPQIPDWLHPITRNLGFVSYMRTTRANRPEGWLYGSLTEWR